MKTTFTYPLPVENYVAGISTTRVGTYEYDGPEQIVYEISDGGVIIDIDPEYEIFDPATHRKIVDPKNNPDHLPVAYFYEDRFKTGSEANQFKDGFYHNYSFVDETQSNGDVYKAKDNLRLSDAYTLSWDHDKSNGVGVASGNWHFEQKLRDLSNIHKQRAEDRKEIIGIHTTNSLLTSGVKTGLNAYIAELDTFIANNPPLKEWKFTNTPMVGTMPTLNGDLRVALENLDNAPTLEEGI